MVFGRARVKCTLTNIACIRTHACAFILFRCFCLYCLTHPFFTIVLVVFLLSVFVLIMNFYSHFLLYIFLPKLLLNLIYVYVDVCVYLQTQNTCRLCYQKLSAKKQTRVKKCSSSDVLWLSAAAAG